MMMVTILVVSLTAAVPSVYVAGQREREEELVFRGNEYARAIAFFHRRFNRYPTSVNELLRTSGLRFLRRAYTDPMTREGKWRFVHANAAGHVFDSHVLTAPPQAVGSKQEDSSAVPIRGQRRPGGFSSDENEMQGAFIMGVASTSKKESFRVWNNHTHYDEWEFLGTEALLAPAVFPGAGQQDVRGESTGRRFPRPRGRQGFPPIPPTGMPPLN